MSILGDASTHPPLQIKNPRVSHTQLRSRLADTSVLRLSQVRWGARGGGGGAPRLLATARLDWTGLG